MRRLDPLELLDLFDRCGSAPAIERSAALISLAYPHDDALRETPGRRNSRLMEIRRVNLGRRMLCLTSCRSCAQTLEIEIDTLDFADHRSTALKAVEHVSVEHDGYTLNFRLPVMADIQASARSASPLIKLLTSCAIDLPREIRIDDPELLDKVSDAFDAADPLGCIVLETRCPACFTVTQPVLDPAGLVWHEFASLARRLEDDVHVLARAYGWRESEILDLPPARRSRYVARALS